MNEYTWLIVVCLFVIGGELYARYDERVTEEREPGILNFREYLGMLLLWRDC